MIEEVPLSNRFNEIKQHARFSLEEINKLVDYLEQQPLDRFSYIKMHGASLAPSANFFLSRDQHIQGVEAVLNRDIKQTGAVERDYLLVIDRYLWRTMKFKQQNLVFQNRLHRACIKEIYASELYRVMHCSSELLNKEFPAADVKAWQLPSYAW